MWGNNEIIWGSCVIMLFSYQKDTSSIETMFGAIVLKEGKIFRFPLFLTETQQNETVCQQRNVSNTLTAEGDGFIAEIKPHSYAISK